MTGKRLWTDEEIAILIENYNKVTNDKLAEMLPGRTEADIYKKGYGLGLRKSKEIYFQNRVLAQKRLNAKRVYKKHYTEPGYISVFKPDHHRADGQGRVLEHILVFEEATGVKVPRNCVVHHLNGIRTDNRIENLCLMERGAHTAYHHKGKNLPMEERHFKNPDPNEMLWLRNSGKSVAEICAVYGISVRTYYRKIKNSAMAVENAK